MREDELKACLTGMPVTALAVAATLAIAGCGSDSSADSATPTTIQTSSIAKPAFTKKANAICKLSAARLLEETAAYQQKHIDDYSKYLMPKIVRNVIRPALRNQIEQIRKLGAPQGDAPQLEEFFATLLHGTDEIIARKVTTLDEAEGMLFPASDIARRYGIDQCRYPLVEPS